MTRPYEAPDFYGIDALLSEEERMARDTVRAWVSERYLPLVEDAYRAGRVPVEPIHELAHVALVWAKLDGVVLGFLVERGAKGFSTKEQKRKHSLRASVTSELVLQDVRLPATAMLPKAEGLSGPLSCLNQARYGIAWGVIGAAMACYDEVRGYGATRVQFGKPIAGFQLYQAKLANMLTEITKAQLVNLRLGRLKDEGKVTPQQV